MENTINERIGAIMESLRMNVNSFSKSLSKSYTAIDAIIKGKSKPGYELLEGIMAAYPKVNPAWLLTGKGEMFISNEKQDSKNSVGDTYLREHLKTLEENFARLSAQLEVKDKQLEAKDKQLEATGRTVEGLQRTVDALLVNMPGKPNDTSFPSRIIPLWPLKEKAAV